MARSGLTFTKDSLTPALHTGPAYIDSTLARTMGFYRPKVEASARLNAPWTDRTTNARNGLVATYAREGADTHSIILAHRVSYGIFLEVRFAGKFAIIMPTINEYFPKIMATLNKILEKRLAR